MPSITLHDAKGADAGTEQRHAGIEPGEQGHQHQRPEGHEKDLAAGHRLAPRRFPALDR